MTTERIKFVVASIDKSKKITYKELIVIIQSDGSFELDWQITEEKMESSQFDYQEEVYRRYSENAHEALMSVSKPYQVTISIQPLSNAIWQVITKNCGGKIDSLQELIEGKFPKTLSELFTAKGEGLFPASKEIRLQCSCPDGANMCKHVAAALYGVGARLDDDPTLFFVLRNVKVDDLISETISQKTETLLEKSKAKSRRVIEDRDISDMFGIEMETKVKKKKVKKGRV